MEMTALNTWKPTTAGILNIISGALSALAAIGIIIALISINSINLSYWVPAGDTAFIAPMVSTMLIISLIFCIIWAVFPILGGVFALQRKRWGWALAGSIIVIFGTLPLGVASTVLVAMAKDEFE